MSRPRTCLPISPAPARRVRYPRIGAAWRAFLASALAPIGPSLAQADCALPTPEARSAATGAHAVAASKPAATQKAPATTAPKPATGRGVADRPSPPGRMVAPRPPNPPSPGAPMPVSPPAPNKVVVPDGARGSVQPADPRIHLHPHGPDEPCLAPDDTTVLVVRWT